MDQSRGSTICYMHLARSARPLWWITRLYSTQPWTVHVAARAVSNDAWNTKNAPIIIFFSCPMICIAFGSSHPWTTWTAIILIARWFAVNLPLPSLCTSRTCASNCVLSKASGGCCTCLNNYYEDPLDFCKHQSSIYRSTYSEKKVHIYNTSREFLHTFSPFILFGILRYLKIL